MKKRFGKREKEEVATIPWHALPVEEAYKKLQSRLDGLSDSEVAERHQEFGRNVLPAKKPPSLVEILLHQFKSPLIYILLAAGCVSVLIGDIKDAVFIFLVLALNAGLGTFQEWKAEQSAAALQSLLKVYTRVRRDGVERQIAADELTPGDVVLLESGNRVPADLRLIQVNNLAIDESFLTGESLAVEKSLELLPEDAPVSERLNMAFAGSTVTSGRSVGLVAEIGLRTQVGKIAETVTLAEAAKPPLVIRMETFARQVSLVVLGASALLAVVAVAQGMPYAEVFFLAVALAVSAIPEGLPVALTVALSVATNRMAKRHVIVRKLAAVEALGSCTLIASDKTGTLTVNQQTAKSILLPSDERFVVSREGYAGEGQVLSETGDAITGEVASRLEELARAAILCNEATLVRQNGEWTHHGDAVDVALLALGYKLGLEPESIRRQSVTVGEIPFESERRYAAKLYRADGRVRVAVKGAAETVVPFCQAARTAQGSDQLDPEAVERQVLSLSANGYRVIAVAQGEVEGRAEFATFEEEDLPPLTLLGLVGLIDPLRPEAQESVIKCQRAGIEVAMITGDHPATALAIARELGIAHSQEGVVTGQQLAEIGCCEVPEYLEVVKSARVFARVTPLQKLHIVEAMMKLGHFVAVTGDGVNDAPALRKANIGVAMGSGTDVAKDTASMIITDDNFASIEAGVEEGRFAYDNVRKVTYLLISAGAAEILLFTLAIVSGLPLPLFAVQLLWLNLVTNGIQDVALAFEGGEPGAMTRPPRKPTEGIFNRLMIQQTVISGGVIGLASFAVWYGLLHAGWDEFAARNLVLLLMVLFENYHVFNCRSEYVSAFKVPLRRNVVLVAGVGAALGLHLLSMQIPFMQSLLRVGPVSITEFVPLLVLAASVLLAMEVFKLIRSRRLAGQPGS